MRFSNIQIVIVLTILGTLIRWMYGLYFTAWNQAPDHIAWELILREGSWNYAQLIHYPHEGGSIVVSLISRLSLLFTSYNSLVVSALILDSTSRFIQLWVVSKVFSQKVFRVFGIWTLFATPIILLWGMVNFGLHNISSVFPFLFLYLIHSSSGSNKSQWVVGIFLGCAIWFSYANWTLLPVYLVYHSITLPKKTFPSATILGFSIIFIIHLLTRLNFDPGFHLSNYGITSIRDIDFFKISSDHIDHIIGVGIKVLPQFAVGNTATYLTLIPIVILWFVLFLLSFWGVFISSVNNKYSKSVYFVFLIIPFFLVLYGLSPFYYGNIQNGNFITYRHLTYVFPLLSVMIITGIFELKYQRILITLYLCIPIISVGITIKDPIYTSNHKSSIKAAGWVIGAKFGHDPSKLQNVISGSENYDLLLEGAGWGVCTALFEKPVTSKDELSGKVDQLLEINSQLKPSQQIIFLQGVKYAFSPEANPQLPQEILNQILEQTAP